MPKALEPQEVHRSEDGGPYAVQTLLGWTINGPLGRPSKSSLAINCIQSHAVFNQQFDVAVKWNLKIRSSASRKECCKMIREPLP